MNTGKYLKELITRNNVALGLSPADVKERIHSSLRYNNDSFSNSDIVHKGGYLVSALDSPHLTIRRFIEYFRVFNYETLEFTFVLNRKPKSIERKMVIPVNVAVDNYGEYLKKVVMDMNVDYKISPTKLDSNVKTWVNRNFIHESSEDKNHRSGNILSSLAKDHITWKRLVHYLLTFNPITIDVIVVANKKSHQDTMKITIITNEVIENEF